MAQRIHKFVAKTAEGVEQFINLLPVDVFILGAPQQFFIKDKKKWIVWFMPYSDIDKQKLELIRKPK